MILALGNRMSFPIESESYRKTMNGKKSYEWILTKKNCSEQLEMKVKKD